jgi:hypothetical protein
MSRSITLDVYGIRMFFNASFAKVTMNWAFDFMKAAVLG